MQDDRHVRLLVTVDVQNAQSLPASCRLSGYAAGRETEEDRLHCGSIVCWLRQGEVPLTLPLLSSESVASSACVLQFGLMTRRYGVYVAV